MISFSNNTSFVAIDGSIRVILDSKYPATANHIHSFSNLNQIPSRVLRSRIEFFGHCITPVFMFHGLLPSRWNPVGIGLQACSKVVSSNWFDNVVLGTCGHLMPRLCMLWLCRSRLSSNQRFRGHWQRRSGWSSRWGRWSFCSHCGLLMLLCWWGIPARWSSGRGRRKRLHKWWRVGYNSYGLWGRRMRRLRRFSSCWSG